MGSNMFAIVDVLILGLGGYLFYAWYLAKFKGEVLEKVLLSQSYPIKKCKDKEGYLNYIAPRLLVFALLSILVGIIGLADDFFSFLGGYYMILVLIFLIVVIWYSLAVKKCYQLFW